ncbi:MAG: hypothetical protein PHP45_08400 [Elusimicrobiales bacterium]|nr:hypothetical protein [Elusimicrobiales bacterium]
MAAPRCAETDFVFASTPKTATPDTLHLHGVRDISFACSAIILLQKLSKTTALTRQNCLQKLAKELSVTLLAGLAKILLSRYRHGAIPMAEPRFICAGLVFVREPKSVAPDAFTGVGGFSFYCNARAIYRHLLYGGALCPQGLRDRQLRYTGSTPAGMGIISLGLFAGRPRSAQTHALPKL